ncbi:MAG: gamma-glutamyltransferase [Deltaproteobacteria bacterium]|nr:gamma-glutamyltransferase [Deltaproteobacteria bacterium]
MHGVVSAGNPYTAEAAAEVLRAGGNAVDAVVAAALASFVAEPLLASAGGSGMMTIALRGREPAVVDFFSDTPGRGGLPEAPDFAAVEVDFGSATQVFHVGRGSVAVPLALPGLALAAKRFGTLPLSDLVEPAARIARLGVPVAAETCWVFELLWPIVNRDPDTRALYSSHGGLPQPGELHVNPALSAILMDFGRLGKTPPLVTSQMLEAFGPQRGGLLSAADVAEAKVEVLPPRRIRIGDWEVITSPRVGGALLGVIVEALTAGTPETSDAEEALRIARASLTGHRAREGFNQLGSTTHISVVDAQGGACSTTLTNGEGCGHLIPGTGIQMNNFLGEEDLNPQGFHVHPPGAHLPSMIAPTVALYRGEPVFALGSGGSNRIRSAVAEVLYRVAVLGSDLDTAVGAPRVHAEEGQVWVELEGLEDPEAVVGALKREFEQVFAFEKRAFFFGGVHAVLRDMDAPAASQLRGVGDIRRGGVAVEV